MEALVASLQAALAVAMATTFDDNIYLTGFFSETNRRFRPDHVVVGELFGFTVLISASVLASRFLVSSMPAGVTGWLGTVPIAIGLTSLATNLRRPRPAQPDPPALTARPAVGARSEQGFEIDRPPIWRVFTDRRTFMVASITISNGGNNLAIYIPLITNSTPEQALITVLVCYLAVLCWLMLSFQLTRLPGVAIVLSRHASRIFPFVLMWLGFRILSDSGVLAR